ncbi:MAG: hypothetical protein JXA51_01595 [Dehalococcoidales bacterium]|nr:hypothetical protein [Dehalococcoidales bacterium]
MTAAVLLAVVLGTTAAGLQPMTASAADGPDLIVHSITLSPPEPALDDMVTITVTVKNQGNASSNNSHVTCYVDNTVLATNPINSVVAGTSKSTSFTWQAQIGSHIIKAVADSGGAVAETDETNNTGTYNISTLAPDLVVQSITWEPAEPSRGDPIVFTVTILNQGNSRAKASTLNLFIDGNSRGYQDIPAINPGETTTRTHNWVALLGQHAIKAVVDHKDQVSEGNETNNELTATFTTIPPDLVVSEITWDPENPSRNDTVTFIVTVKNQGGGRSDPCHLAYFFNGEYQSSLAVSSLEAEASENVTFTWTAREEEHEVKASVDFYGNITESDENNNELTVSLLTAAPDLIIEDVTWLPEDAANGDTVTFTITVKNLGTGKAAASRIAYYISGGYQGYQNIEAMGPDATQTATIQWLASTGTHTVSIAADCDGMLTETNEENNKLTKTIPIIPPDLIISEIYWEPENPDIGETVTFTTTVKNQGGGKADYFYVAYYVDDILLTMDSVTNLVSGQSENVTCTWPSQNGHHDFKAIADSKKQVIEYNEDNNESTVTVAPKMPDLVIGTVTWTPADMPAGEEVTFSIAVENQGTLESGPSRVNYYIDGSYVGFADIGPLEAGAVSTEILVWGATAGYHTIEIVADSSDEITELDEENNPKVITLPPSDLLIQDITWSPLDASIGDIITFTATFKNQGGSKTQEAQATCYIDGLPVDTLELPEIEAAASATRSFEWVARSGLHTILVIADEHNRVTETDETNNEKEIGFTTMTPDLVIEDISWLMDYPLISDDVTFTITVRNQGSDTSGANRLMYNIDDSSEIFKDIELIPAGETASITFNALLESGPHTINTAVDFDDDVSELDETNNEKELEFSTSSPDLAIPTITWLPLGAVPGDTLTITAQVENRGKESAVNPRLVLQIDGSPAGTIDMGEIASGTTLTGEFTWTVEAGVHEISVFADMDGLISETNEINNSKTRTLTIVEPAVPVKKAVDLSANSDDDGLIGGSWWLFFLVAAVLGGGAFYAALKSFKKR